MPLVNGPTISSDDNYRDTGYLMNIQLPYQLPDFIANRITLTHTTNFSSVYNYVNKINTADHNLDTTIVSGRLISREGEKRIQNNTTGAQYVIGNEIGHGAYGFVHICNKDKIIKFQKLKTSVDEIGFVKEGIIHHILYESTKYDTHNDCQYVPQLFDMFTLKIKNKTYGIYILKKYENTIDSYLKNRNYFSKTILMKITRKLDRLWELYKYNHCDLHLGNVLYHGTNIVLNDFGFSLLTLEDREGRQLVINTHEYAENESRDLTHMSMFLETVYPRKIKSDAKCIINGSEQYCLKGDPNPHAILNPMLYNTIFGANRNWHNVYIYMNYHHNLNANPINVLSTFNISQPIIQDMTCSFQKVAMTHPLNLEFTHIDVPITPRMDRVLARQARRNLQDAQPVIEEEPSQDIILEQFNNEIQRLEDELFYIQGQGLYLVEKGYQNQIDSLKTGRDKIMGGYGIEELMGDVGQRFSEARSYILHHVRADIHVRASNIMDAIRNYPAGTFGLLAFTVGALTLFNYIIPTPQEGGHSIQSPIPIQKNKRTFRPYFRSQTKKISRRKKH